MSHLPSFITDLALILAIAGVTTLFFRRIRQPIVLGYIIAGFLVGPHVSLIPTVIDDQSVKTWSEIGVIFLLFSLGLEFSFKKLVKVGGAASITGLTGIIIMFGLGYLTGRWLDWNTMDCVFLGAVLSISSTTIIVRAFDELGVRTRKFAQLVFGVLIIQDLVAVVMMVILATFTAGKQFSGYDLMIQMLKLVFFLTLWFLSGTFFIPSFLKSARKLLNDETALIVSIALCLAMVLLAVNVGFSSALGAFIMGSILAETQQGERIEVLVKPVKNLFAAIFFVSVGMMIDPTILGEHAATIGVLITIVLVGMPLSVIVGALISGQSLKHAVQSGMTLSQIGEFSFIIASLGVSLKVTNEFLYPITVAVSTITTFTTPFMIKGSTRVLNLLERILPDSWVQAINRYSTSSQQLSAFSEWKELLRGYGINSAIHAVILIAIIFLSQRSIEPFLSTYLSDSLIASVISLVVTLLVMMPFIWALAIRRVRREAYAHLWLNRRLNRGPLIALEIARIMLAIVFVAALVEVYFSLTIALIIGVLVMAVAIVLFNQKLQAFYERIEHRFLANLNDREKQQVFKHTITPWDAHLAHFDVLPEFSQAGRQLQELKLRENYGVNIALIERGNLSIITPDRYERLYPGDKLSVIGTDDQLARVKELFERVVVDPQETYVQEDAITLQNFTVTRDSRLHNQTIRQSQIRETAQALVVGLERNGQRMLNPDSRIRLTDGDIVWIVGVKQRVEEFLK